MNRQFKKMMSGLLVLFMVLTGVPVPAAMAADGDPVAGVTAVTTSVYSGTKLDLTQTISNVSNSVYQQVYGYEATITFDSSKLELTGLSTSQKNFNTPTKTEITPGQYKINVDLKSGSSPVTVGTNAANILQPTFTAKSVSTASTATVSFSDISLVNQSGGKLKASDTSLTLNVLPAVTYDLNLQSWDATKDQAYAAMERYLVKPAKLSVVQGKKIVTLALNSGDIIPDFNVEQSGELSASKIVSFDEVAKTRTFQFEVDDLSKLLNVQVHVLSLQPAHEARYNFRLKFDVGNNMQLNTLITEAQTYYNITSEGTVNGQAAAGSKAVLQTAINAAKTVADNVVATQQQVDQATVTLQAALDSFNASRALLDGDYNIGFMIYKKGTSEQSVMYDYVDPASGKLTVQGDKKYVSFKLKQSAEIKSFKTEKAGVLTETETVDQDTSANTRVVRFEVSDLQSRSNGWVKIYWQLPPPIGLYDHEYDVEIGLSNIPVFDAGKINDLTFDVWTADKTALYPQMAGFFKKPGKIMTRQGKKTVALTLTSGTLISSLKVGQNGVLKEAEIANTDTVANLRTFQFEVNDLSDFFDAQLTVPAANHTYTFSLKFDVGAQSPLNMLITNAQSRYNVAVEGTENGQYPVGSKAVLLAAINAAKVVASNAGATQQQVNDATAALKTALDTFNASVINSNTSPGTGAAAIPDGTYNIDYTIFKKDSNERSVMYDYVDRSSGKLLVQGGKKYVSFTLNKSAEITSFKTSTGTDSSGNAIFVEATNSDINTTANTRVVKFEVNDLSARLLGTVKIYWQVSPDFLYNEQYEIELGFGSVNLPITQTVNAGQYNFGFTAPADDPSAPPITNLVDTTGGLKVQNGKQTVTFKLKSGVSASKINQLNTDGTIKRTFTPTVTTETAAKSPGLVRVLAAGDSNMSFDVDDLTATYQLFLMTGGVESSYRMQFSSISPTGTVDSGNGNNENGNGTGGTGGSTGGSSGGCGSCGSTTTFTDGKYTMNYTIMKYGTSEPSVMQGYVITPGLLSVENGKMYFSLTLKQSKEITSFQTESSGSLTETEVVSKDDKQNTRVVKFEVKDLSSRLKGWVKIDWAEMNYFHSYDVEISFDKSSAQKTSSDATLGGGGAASAVASLKDGEYDLDFKTLQYKSNLDSNYNSLFAHPAKLIVKDSKRTVSLTINDHKRVDDFKMETVKPIENAAEYGMKVTSETVLSSIAAQSTNEEANTRVVNFEVKDFTSPIHVQLALVIPPTDEELAQHEKAVEQAKTNGDGYIPTLKKNLENVDVDLLFNIDALGKKIEEQQAAEQAAAANGGDQGTAAGLSDIGNHWAKASIEQAVSLGIVNGYEDGTFRPNGEVTRSEFTVMLNRALKLEGQKADLTFSDLSNVPDWVKPSLEQAVGAGIISSYEDGTFRGGQNISRAEIAVMVVRALGLPTDANDKLIFADAGQVPQWAYAQIAAASKKGIINGRDNNLFAPNASATRAEAVTLILALLANK
ncbi:NEAT domain-containing protein [Paenibacillus thalictri]|uniref:S-layer homology domain-containing protein n=1 Tax=Paenibacillus thalictri TaxID=2527873 RepID=A0A4Q9DN93_9BACL|nr:NEAT domain-containing protein [Paenibacillus thalictri]TBL73913.1 hypothetical protein EYB31_25740 [Paenibacillus thalictri]